MAKALSYQHSLINDLTKNINSHFSNGMQPREVNEARIGLLEQVAAVIGGFDVKEYYKLIGVEHVSFHPEAASSIAGEIRNSKLCPSLILSLLSTEELETGVQKKNGVYYTDYRLAMKMASQLEPLFIASGKAKSFDPPKIIDLSSGTGILLSAVLETFKEKVDVDKLLGLSIYAVDISAMALRGALLSLSSFTNRIETIRSLKGHLLLKDSLVNEDPFWHSLSAGGFDAVIGNPPWEKLKLSRHEYELFNGEERHYGMKGKKFTSKKEHHFNDQKQKIKEYSDKIGEWLKQVKGEKDLYMPFLKLGLDILKPNGLLIQLVPASLIRNKNTELLRRYLVDNSTDFQIKLFDNKARFFEIDTRFKFILLTLKKGNGLPSIGFATSSFKQEIYCEKHVDISVPNLRRIRADLSFPEVRTLEEWNLFQRLSNDYPSFGAKSSIWKHAYSREIDMTLDRDKFLRTKGEEVIPLIEGRMIHQFVTGIKRFREGSGRKAIWVQSPPNKNTGFYPQFFVKKHALTESQKRSSNRWRVGFCDITGQTNERTMLSALIPPGCICGNKVPTLEFEHEENFELLPSLWLGLSNSFVFDWLIRRIITTNANFFIVDSIPLPTADFNDPLHTEIAQLSRELLPSLKNGYTWNAALLRAEIEARVALSYRITYAELELIFEDFPILDKTQPLLEGEKKCTVTKDLTLFCYLKLAAPENRRLDTLNAKITLYKKINAVPFVPTQFNANTNDLEPIIWHQGTHPVGR